MEQRPTAARRLVPLSPLSASHPTTSSENQLFQDLHSIITLNPATSTSEAENRHTCRGSYSSSKATSASDERVQTLLEGAWVGVGVWCVALCCARALPWGEEAASRARSLDDAASSPPQLLGWLAGALYTSTGCSGGVEAPVKSSGDTEKDNAASAANSAIADRTAVTAAASTCRRARCSEAVHATLLALGIGSGGSGVGR